MFERLKSEPRELIPRLTVPLYASVHTPIEAPVASGR
jgi:hypothetical protein